MEVLRWKTRIAVLWVLMAVATSAHSLLVFMEPGAMEKMASEMETMGAGMWVFLTLFWFIPLWMAFVSLTLKDSANRWTNITLGIIFTILNIWHFLECGLALIGGGPIGEPTAHHILLVGSTVVATALIAWFAWKWPED